MTKLTDEERKTKGIELATMNNDMMSLDEQAKATANDFKERIGGFAANVRVLSHIVSRGEEIRDVECTVRFGVPDKKHKTIVRDDTGETVAVEEMNEFDLQPELL